MAKSISGIKITELIVGEGVEAEMGKAVTVHWRGFLNKREQFRSSYDMDGGQPHTLRIGERHSIPGFEKGIIGMRVGGKRKISVSPHLAYRDRAVPGIPPNAVLIFEIELIDVHD